MCLSAVAFHLLFAVAAALPDVVLCHRPGGEIALEFSGPAGICLCQECDHCLARLSKEAAGHLAGNPVLDACHCAHESFLNRAEREILKRDDGRSLSTLQATAVAHPAVEKVSGPKRPSVIVFVPPGTLPAWLSSAEPLRC